MAVSGDVKDSLEILLGPRLHGDDQEMSGPQLGFRV